MTSIKLSYDTGMLKNDDQLLYWSGVFNNLGSATSQQQRSKVITQWRQNSSGSRATLRVPTRVYDVEGVAICAKNSTFDLFDGAA